MINLRKYQDQGVNAIRRCFLKLIFKVLYVLPTGGGKTVLFTYIAQRMASKGNKVMILVHRIELLRQTSSALAKFDVDHGMINPEYTPNYTHAVQVASVQTIINRLNYFAAVNWIPDTIIIDEAHHATAGSWRKVVAHFEQLNPKLTIIGVTATPIRTDGQGLGTAHKGMFDELIAGPTPKWLMDEGYLVRAKVLSPPSKADTSSLKRGKGDFNKNDLESIMNKPTITGDAVDHYEQICAGVPTIVFCTTVKHTEQVAQEFRNRGYKFYAIDGTTDDDERKRVLQGLADGSVQGVCSCDLINEGTDVPAATCAILLRPTASLSLHLQQIGRVLRPVYAEGYDLTTVEGRLAAIENSDKKNAFILDHVGNVGSYVNGEFIQKHGLPVEEHQWTLDGEVKRRGKKKTEETPVKVQQCLSCFAVHEPAPVCPECGHVYIVKDRTPKKTEGQLKEITEADIKKKEARVEVGKSQTLEELKAIARQRGYNSRWADIQFDLKTKKKEAKLEKMAVKIAIEKSQEIPFEELPAMDLVQTTDLIRNINVMSFEIEGVQPDFDFETPVLFAEFSDDLEF